MTGFQTAPKWYPVVAIPTLLVTLLCAMFSGKIFGIVERYRYGKSLTHTATLYSSKSPTISSLELPISTTISENIKRPKPSGERPILPTVMEDVLDITKSATNPQTLSKDEDEDFVPYPLSKKARTGSLIQSLKRRNSGVASEIQEQLRTPQKQDGLGQALFRKLSKSAAPVKPALHEPQPDP
jgi:hypothetical protein